MSVSSRRLSLAVAATVTALAASAAPALAGEAVTDCGAVATSNPFAIFGDNADYQLAPGGDVEDDGASWSLTGGAGVAGGNESFQVTSAGDRHAMRLPGSASATTARMCISAEHPSFRFFARRAAGSAKGRLRVEVVYDDAAGVEVSRVAGEITGTSDWAPSAALPTMIGDIAGAQGTADVSFRFQSQGGVWSIDDVYVDPIRSTR